MSQSNRISRPRMRRAVVTMVVLWFGYLVGVNWLVNTDLLVGLVAKHPERMRMSWERAWTVVPGLVHVRGFSMWNHTRGIEWRLQVDRGRALVNFFALPFRTFQAVTASAGGIDFELEKADTVLPRKQKKKPGFRIHFIRASATDVRSARVGELELTGPFRAGGGFSTRARGAMQVSRGRLRVPSGTVTAAGQDLATELNIDARVSIDKHVPRDHKEEGILPFLVARVKLSGHTEDLSILKPLLRGVDRVAFGGGSGRIDADVRLTRGVVEPTSRLVTEEAAYTVEYLGYRATGTGRILAFAAADQTIDEFLRFDLGDFALAAHDEDDPYLMGNHLSVSLRREGGFTIGGPNPPLDLVVDMAESTVPDMSAYNRFLPDNGSIRVVSGVGTVSSRLELLERSGGGSATADLTATDLIVELKGKRVVADLTTAARATILDPRPLVFDPSGTRVEIRNADIAVEGIDEEGTGDAPNRSADWWCDLEIPAGRVAVGRPPEISADFIIHGASAEPLFALIAKSQKKADKLERRIDTDELTGSGHIVLEHGTLAATDVEVTAGKAAARAELCLHGKDLHGLLHTKYGILAAAVELHDGKETLHITSPRKWFERNREAFVCGPEGR